MEGPQKCHPPAHFAKYDGPIVSRKRPKPVMVRSGKTTKAKAVRGRQVSAERASDSPRPHPCAQSTKRTLKDTQDSGDEESRHSITHKTLGAETIIKLDKNDTPEVEDDVTELSTFAFPCS